MSLLMSRHPGTCTQISYGTNQTWQIIEPIQPAAMHEAVPPIETFQMIQPVQTFETFEMIWMGGGRGGDPPLPSQPAAGSGLED